VSTQAFTVAFLTGGALVALWIVRRVESCTPGSFRAIAVHLVAANVLGALTVPLTLAAAPVVWPVGAMMLIAFPPLVYVLVAAAWLLLFVQRLAGSYR
jgi:hypothetical protein